jgi:surface polysaccharide O-acyltransferase-like enzyme
MAKIESADIFAMAILYLFLSLITLELELTNMDLCSTLVVVLSYISSSLGQQPREPRVISCHNYYISSRPHCVCVVGEFGN